MPVEGPDETDRRVLAQLDRELRRSLLGQDRAVEAVTRKKIDPKYEGYLHGAGMVLLLGLMALIMFKDIFVLLKG